MTLRTEVLVVAIIFAVLFAAYYLIRFLANVGTWL